MGKEEKHYKQTKKYDKNWKMGHKESMKERKGSGEKTNEYVTDRLDKQNQSLYEIGEFVGEIND